MDDVLTHLIEATVVIVLGAFIFQSSRHKQADDAMARTIDAQQREIESLRRRIANGGERGTVGGGTST